MKREELKEIVGEENIDKVMALYGKSVNSQKEEIDKLKTEIETLKGVKDEVESKDKELEELKTQIKSFNETQTELETLKKEIADKEQEAKELEEAKAFEESFNKLIGDNKFINEETKEMFITKFKNARVEDKTDEEVFKELVGERTDLFDSPNKLELPATSEVEDNLTDESRLKSLIGLE